MDMNFPFLLGAQVPQIDPLRIAGKALTLGDLATKNQLMQFQLQTQQQLASAMSDPDYWQAFQNIMGGQGSMTDIGQVAQKYPLAANVLQQNVLGVQEKMADITEKTAKARLSNQETLDKRLTNIQRMAEGGAPADVLAGELQFAGVDPRKFYDPNNPQAFGQTVAQQLQDPKVRSDMLHQAVENWRAYSQEKLAYANANKPEMKESEVTGKVERFTPYGAGGGPQMPQPPAGVGAPPAATLPNLPAGASVNFTGPVSGAAIQGALADANKQGAPAQQQPAAAAEQPVKYTGPQREQIAAGGGELKELLAQSMPAGQTKTMIEDLRNREAQGIYSGAIGGQKAWQDFLSVGAQAGWLSPDTLKKLANSQAWDAEAMTLVAQSVRQFAGARVAARELAFFQQTKPQRLQTPEGREELYQNMWKIADRVQQQANLAGQHFAQYGELTSFQPKFVDRPMPNPVVPNMPDPTTHKGWKVRDPSSGVMYQSDGVRWNTLQTQPSDVPR